MRPLSSSSRLWGHSGLLGLIALGPALVFLQEPVADTLPEHLPVRPPLGLDGHGQDHGATAGEQSRDPSWLTLGRRLFFDPILSVDRTIACASCHQPDHGFADPRPLSQGVRGRLTTRNAPTLFNRALGRSFMWDGQAQTLEEQVLLPVQNPLEMDLPLTDALERLTQSEQYREAFAALGVSPPDEQGLSLALATFIRRLWHGNSAVDRFRAGDVRALSPQEKAGLWIYESRGGCWRCHTGPNFTDESFHNTGIGLIDGESLPGRMGISGDSKDRGAFKTPTLRGLAETGPYMHDGSMVTLEDVVEFYREGAGANPSLDPRLGPLSLSDQDVTNLLAFLRALSRVEPADTLEDR